MKSSLLEFISALAAITTILSFSLQLIPYESMVFALFVAFLFFIVGFINSIFLRVKIYKASSKIAMRIYNYLKKGGGYEDNVVMSIYLNTVDEYNIKIDYIYEKKIRNKLKNYIIENPLSRHVTNKIIDKIDERGDFFR